jgi:hypothetical protein
MDGTHIPCDIKYRDRSQVKIDFKSTKPNSKDRYCWNFVVGMLMNGFISFVLKPLPSRRSDSQVMKLNENMNFLNNSLDQSVDVLLGDGNFKCFSFKGANKHLVHCRVQSRPEKPRNANMSPISRAMADELSNDRNKIEQDFGWHKHRFESQAAKKGHSIVSGSGRWAHATVANSFALENIHNFPHLCNLSADFQMDHLFFDTRPQDGDEGEDLVGDILEDQVNLAEEELERLEEQRFLEERSRMFAIENGIQTLPRARRFAILDEREDGDSVGGDDDGDGGEGGDGYGGYDGDDGDGDDGDDGMVMVMVMVR